MHDSLVVGIVFSVKPISRHKTPWDTFIEHASMMQTALAVMSKGRKSKIDYVLICTYKQGGRPL